MRTNSGDRIIKDQVDNLQVSFDKEAAWMRLQDRMESKDENKGYSRLGWAAAAMLIAGSLFWYVLSEPKTEIVHAPSAKKTMPVMNHTIVRQDPTDNEQQITVKEITTSAPVSKKYKASIGTQQPVIIQPIQETPAIVIEEKPVPQEAPKIVAAPKPKMKVVHINEVAEEERTERNLRNSKYAVEKYNYDELFDDPYGPKNPFKIIISRQN